MITIWGVCRSRATRNIWALEELGLPWRLRPVIQANRLLAKGIDPAAPDAPFNTRSREFLRLSPAGAVPVLEEDGFVLSESLAINLYLAGKTDGPLGPATPREEAQMLQWTLFGATSVESPALAIQTLFGAGRSADDPEVKAAEDSLLRPLAVLEAHLTTHSHIVGGRFTIADINMAEILRYAQPDAALMGRFPRVKGWLELCQSRPAFKRMWQAREAEPA
ncbi:glutathione S-transferase family protein [Paenirhodobacter sp.]|uniref:glutathione S-transferase family protein n=1 Tax=Paenirhodobacter sp. TaxID=1965326 RepID=UPI003B3CFC83